MHCGRTQALTLLGLSVRVLARTLYFLQAWLLTSQVGSNYRNKQSVAKGALSRLSRVGRAGCAGKKQESEGAQAGC